MNNQNRLYIQVVVHHVVYIQHKDFHLVQHSIRTLVDVVFPYNEHFGRMYLVRKLVYKHDSNDHKLRGLHNLHYTDKHHEYMKRRDCLVCLEDKYRQHDDFDHDILHLDHILDCRINMD